LAPTRNDLDLREGQQQTTAVALVSVGHALQDANTPLQRIQVRLALHVVKGQNGEPGKAAVRLRTQQVVKMQTFTLSASPALQQLLSAVPDILEGGTHTTVSTEAS
jgi:hypothetical protein